MAGITGKSIILNDLATGEEMLNTAAVVEQYGQYGVYRQKVEDLKSKGKLTGYRVESQGQMVFYKRSQLDKVFRTFVPIDEGDEADTKRLAS